MIVANIGGSVLVVSQRPGPYFRSVSFRDVGGLPMKEEYYLVQHWHCGVNRQEGHAAYRLKKVRLLVTEVLILP